jgi:hypothetical protein
VLQDLQHRKHTSDMSPFASSASIFFESPVAPFSGLEGYSYQCLLLLPSQYCLVDHFSPPLGHAASMKPAAYDYLPIRQLGRLSMAACEADAR